jgi:hypothetical protein
VLLELPRTGENVLKEKSLLVKLWDTAIMKRTF